uniref:Alcohol dehydrogenase-like N-terminal domain-containing protein n=1 Tax=Salmo trutta TaxID=8032 RepID=A0A674CU04_SALTR
MTPWHEIGGQVQTKLKCCIYLPCVLQIVATAAICHRDSYTLSGSDPEGVFPVVLDHECAGTVERVGEDGYYDPLYIHLCGECKFNENPKTNRCQKVR